MAEPDGFDAFVLARSPALLRFGWLLTGNRATAEDLVQAALMRTWARWGRLESIDSAEPYVRRVMVTQYATWWRRRAKLYSVRGLPSWFRLLSEDGRIFDSQPAAGARRGGEILPLTGQVASIELIAVGGGVRRLTDPAAVSAAIQGIVAAPALPGTPWPYSDAGQLRFRLRDGTTLLRQWNPARGLIDGNIQLPESVVALLMSAR